MRASVVLAAVACVAAAAVLYWAALQNAGTEALPEPMQAEPAPESAGADSGARYTGADGDPDVAWAQVTRVVDGDTVHLDSASHRLVLVNTPERGEPGFAEAGEFVEERCLGRTVAYDLNDPQPADRYGRHLSLVYCDGPLMPSINELLIEAGHSGQYTRFCHESEFADQAWTGC